IESVEKDLLPVDLVRLLLRRRLDDGLRLGLGGFLSLLGLLVFLRLDHVEEGIVQQLLLEVLLEIEQRHVEQVHRLIQARIDLQLLLELGALRETGFHETTGLAARDSRPSSRAPSSARYRARSRAVNVGPR